VVPVDKPRMADDAFARALLSKLTASEGNIVASPASIKACVLLALAGARGQTARQIAATLELAEADLKDIAALLAASRKVFASSRDCKAAATIANSVWVEKTFPVRGTYRKLLEASAEAGFAQVDFASQSETARRTINAWVDAHTQHKIKDLFGPGSIDDSSELVLANAVYFKANWSRPFDEQRTTNQPFHRPGQPDLAVPLMHERTHADYMETDTYQALELPYNQAPYSMVVWLPKRAEDLAAMETAVLTGSIVAALRELGTADVDVYLPRFKVSSSLSLVHTLTALGMKDAFTDAADFSGISSQPLLIAAIVHQAVVEVDEEGTEAAAATGAGFARGIARPIEEEPKTFRADHPFVFAIRNRTTGDILFMGRVETPRE